MAPSIRYHLAFVVVGFLVSITGCYGVSFTIQNRCPFTVWPGSFNPSSGLELPSGQQTILTVPAGQQAGRIWGRTGCDFQKPGPGPKCLTGDCGGLLQCQIPGLEPASLVEFTLNGYQNQDYYDISLVDGFNLPVAIFPNVPAQGKCIPIACSRNINADCPPELRTAGACKSACLAFPSNDLYCCKGQYEYDCPPSDYAKFFKAECPQAYSYARDDASSTFYCPGGSDYTVVFCP